jgi:tetratricopeptide (TPR) repeat protein
MLLVAARYDEAYKQCSTYFTAGDWDAYVDRGRACQGENRLPQALTDYSHAISLMKPALVAEKQRLPAWAIPQPSPLSDAYMDALKLRARLGVKLNRPVSAIVDCNEYLRLAKHSVPEVNVIRGDAFEMFGRPKEALSDFQAVLKEKDVLDRLLKAEKLPDRIHYLKMLSKSSQPTVIHALKQAGIVAEKLSDTPLAITYYSELIGMNVGESEYYLRRAKAYEKLKQYDKAQKDLDTFIMREPKDAVAYDMRARLKSEQGQYSQAADDYTCALKAAPEDGEFLLEKRAKVYEKLGKKDLADQDRRQIEKIKAGRKD